MARRASSTKPQAKDTVALGDFALRLKQAMDARDWSRGCMCWYDARAGREEMALRAKCRAIFGARERHVGEDWRTWGKADEGPSPQRRLP